MLMMIASDGLNMPECMQKLLSTRMAFIPASGPGVEGDLRDPNHCDYREGLNRLIWHISDMARDRARVTNPEARALESSAW